MNNIFAAAGEYVKTADQCNPGGGKLLGVIPRWYEYLPFDANCNINVDFSKNPNDLWKIGFALIDIMLRVGGLVAIGFIIYGGFMFVTSQGDPEGIKKAKSIVLNALIGAVISVLATTIVIFVAGRF